MSRKFSILRTFFLCISFLLVSSSVWAQQAAEEEVDEALDQEFRPPVPEDQEEAGEDPGVVVIQPFDMDAEDLGSRESALFRYYADVNNPRNDTIQLRITLSPFISSTGMLRKGKMRINGKAATPREDGENQVYGPFRLEPDASLGMGIEAQLSEPGIHVSKVSFMSGTETFIFPFKINISAPASTEFSIDDLSTTLSTSAMLWGAPGIWVTLNNPTDFPIEVRLPVPKQVVKVTPDENFNADFRVTYRDQAGNAMDKDQPLILPGRHSERVQVRLKGLTGAGKYTGKLHASSYLGDAEAQEQDFTLLVRHSWFWAALMIFIGVGISTLLRNYLSKGRPRLELRATIAQQRETVQQHQKKAKELGPDASTVLNALERNLKQADQTLLGGDDTAAKPMSESIGYQLQLLPAWLGAKEKVKSLDASLVGKGLEQPLGEMERFLKSKEASQTALRVQQTQLNDLEGNINQTVEIANLLKPLEKDLAKLKNDALPQALNAQVAALDTSSVKAAVQAGDFAGARTALGKVENGIMSAELTLMQDQLGREAKRLKSMPNAPEQKAKDLEAVGKEVGEALSILQGGDTAAARKKFALLKEKGEALGIGTRAGLPVSPDVTDKLMDKISLRLLSPSKAAPKASTLQNRLLTLDLAVMGIILVVVVGLGMQLLYLDNATWGNVGDYFNAVLWGLGLHAAGSYGVFKGLGQMQGQLTDPSALPAGDGRGEASLAAGSAGDMSLISNEVFNEEEEIEEEEWDEEAEGRGIPPLDP